MRWKAVNAATFSLLSAFVFLYYGMIYFQMPAPLAYAAFFAGAVFLCVGLLVETKLVVHRKYTFAQDFEVLAVTLVGGLATFALSTFDVDIGGFGPFGPVVAAGVVGLLGFEILKKFDAVELAAPLYAGAFVGMSSGAIFSFEMVAAASLLAGIVYIAAHELYNGTGGTLGTIAFIGTTAVRKLFGG